MDQITQLSLQDLEQEYFNRLKNLDQKISWDDYFMRLAHMVATRSPDPSTKHGCVIINKNHEIISMGYNGPPANIDDSKVPLTRPDKYDWMIHSEENALMYAKESLDGATVYITGFPCSGCMRKLIQKRVGTIIYGDVQSKCADEKNQKIVQNMIESYMGYMILKYHLRRRVDATTPTPTKKEQIIMGTMYTSQGYKDFINMTNSYDPKFFSKEV